MKCIKNIKTGEIRRVYDEVASDRTDEESWVYCPKHKWKENVRDKK